MTTPATALGYILLCGLLLALGAHARGDNILSGEQAFAACAACHGLDADSEHKVGPSLAGVVGRRAASGEGYNYSPALGDSGLCWTRGNLFAWIASSEQLVPGSWMLYDNHLRPEEVQALIDYLSKNSPGSDPLDNDSGNCEP
jgi:cytochrome c